MSDPSRICPVKEELRFSLGNIYEDPRDLMTALDEVPADCNPDCMGRQTVEVDKNVVVLGFTLLSRTVKKDVCGMVVEPTSSR